MISLTFFSSWHCRRNRFSYKNNNIDGSLVYFTCKSFTMITQMTGLSLQVKVCFVIYLYGEHCPGLSWMLSMAISERNPELVFFP